VCFLATQIAFLISVINLIHVVFTASTVACGWSFPGVAT